MNSNNNSNNSSNNNLPFRFQEVFKLSTLGLDPSLFKFGNLTFESQKYICVKDGGVSNFSNSVAQLLSYPPFNVVCECHRYLLRI